MSEHGLRQNIGALDSDREAPSPERRAVLAADTAERDLAGRGIAHELRGDCFGRAVSPGQRLRPACGRSSRLRLDGEDRVERSELAQQGAVQARGDDAHSGNLGALADLHGRDHHIEGFRPGFEQVPGSNPQPGGQQYRDGGQDRPEPGPFV